MQTPTIADTDILARGTVDNYSGPFEAIAKYSLTGGSTGGTTIFSGIYIITTSGSNSIFNRYDSTNHYFRPRIAGSFGTDQNTTLTSGYYRISRDSSNNVNLYHSTDGVNWGTALQTGTDAGAVTEFQLVGSDKNNRIVTGKHD